MLSFCVLAYDFYLFKKRVLFPGEVLVPTPWDSLPKSFANEFVHIFALEPRNRAKYSSDVTVTESITAFDS